MEQQLNVYQKIRAALDTIQVRSTLIKSGQVPETAVVLGSGLGSIADQLTETTVIPYSEIPGFHGTAVEGHAGKMIIGKMNQVPVVFLQGRFHFYEGYPLQDVVFPTRVVCSLGIHTLVLTNAAGAINTRYRPGDLMFIEDHLNLTGDNPLKGPHLADLGPRFPDLTEAYSKECMSTLTSTAIELGISYHQGIYAGLLGPSYETPAEVRMLRTLGADAVGMSTVSESIAANHMGVRVVGISCITNLAAGLSPHKLTHQEVMEVSNMGSEKMKQLLTRVIPKLRKPAKQ